MSAGQPAGDAIKQEKIVLEDFLVRNDIGLIRIAFFKERLALSKQDDMCKPLLRRQDVPRHHVVHGVQVRGMWTDGPNSAQNVYAVSHAWLSTEHPDPGALHLEALVEDLSWLGAVDKDLVFFDYCSLPQVNLLHPDYKGGEANGNLSSDHEALRTPNQHMQYHTAMRYMDILFSSPHIKVVVMPEIFDMSKFTEAKGKPITHSTASYLERGWCGLEFTAAASAGSICSLARRLNAITTRVEDDLKATEEMDFKELQVTVSAPKQLRGLYKMRGDFEGAPFFERTDGQFLMYRNYEVRFYVGPTIGAISDDEVWAELESGEKEPPECFWKVKYQKHPDVQVAIMRPGTDKVEVKGLAWLRESANGIYEQQGEHHDRPYYKNEQGMFMYCHQQATWYISPHLGVMGDLVWAENTIAMDRPPEGPWRVLPIACPDIKVERPPSADQALVSGFGWVRERGNGLYRITDAHDGGPLFANSDDSVFIYRWREQRWRIARVLGATGTHVKDEIPSECLEPPSGKWKNAKVEVNIVGSADMVTLTGLRATKLPGKMRFSMSEDAVVWTDVCQVQEGFQDFTPPVRARFARFVLQKDLGYLRCIKESGVAYRSSMNLDDKITTYPGPLCGARVPVQGRHGNWIKAEKGYLPLWIGEEKLFRGFPPGDAEAYTCQIMGYRPDVVVPLPGVFEPGLDASQFAMFLKQRRADIRFSLTEDKERVLAMFRRRFGADERKDTFRRILQKAGKGAVRNIADVRLGLQDFDGEVVRMALEILAGLGPKLWPKDIEGIASFLSQPDGYLREAAAHAMYRLGLHAAPYTREVASLLSDPDIDVRIAGAGALSTLGPKAEARAKGAAKLLVDLLMHQDREVRKKSVNTLAVMGEFGSVHADEVAERLNDKVLGVRLAATACLAAMGEPGAKHADRLVPMLNDGYMRQSVIAALTKMDRHTDAVAALLECDVTPTPWYVRRDVLLALQEVGPAGAMHCEATAALLRDIHRDVRLAAIKALKAMGPANMLRHAVALRAVASDQAEEVELRRVAHNAVADLEQAEEVELRRVAQNAVEDLEQVDGE